MAKRRSGTKTGAKQSISTSTSNASAQGRPGQRAHVSRRTASEDQRAVTTGPLNPGSAKTKIKDRAVYSNVSTGPIYSYRLVEPISNHLLHLTYPCTSVQARALARIEAFYESSVWRGKYVCLKELEEFGGRVKLCPGYMGFNFPLPIIGQWLAAMWDIEIKGGIKVLQLKNGELYECNPVVDGTLYEDGGCSDIGQLNAMVQSDVAYINKRSLTEESPMTVAAPLITSGNYQSESPKARWWAPFCTEEENFLLKIIFDDLEILAEWSHGFQSVGLYPATMPAIMLKQSHNGGSERPPVKLSANGHTTALADNTGPYLISYLSQSHVKSSMSTITTPTALHEFSHFLYHSSEPYKLLTSTIYHSPVVSPLTRELIGRMFRGFCGYHESVFEDEFQAYLVAEGVDWFLGKVKQQELGRGPRELVRRELSLAREILQRHWRDSGWRY